jgi:hypothetical protein
MVSSKVSGSSGVLSLTISPAMRGLDVLIIEGLCPGKSCLFMSNAVSLLSCMTLSSWAVKLQDCKIPKKTIAQIRERELT